MKKLLLVIGIVFLLLGCGKVDKKFCWLCTTKIQKDEWTYTEKHYLCNYTIQEIRIYVNIYTGINENGYIFTTACHKTRSK